MGLSGPVCWGTEPWDQPCLPCVFPTPSLTSLAVKRRCWPALGESRPFRCLGACLEGQIAATHSKFFKCFLPHDASYTGSAAFWSKGKGQFFPAWAHF